MDWGSMKKRSREDLDFSEAAAECSKKGRPSLFLLEENAFEIFSEAAAAGESSRRHRPLGVFDFPWHHKGEGGALFAPMESEGRDLLEVFFSSLVDGCSAAIGFPGDRLSRAAPASIALPTGWEEDGDGSVDCIWSCVLSQPLYSKASSTA